MGEIEIGTETEGDNHWSYQVTVYDGGKCHVHEVTLSWRDYDLWSRGKISPAKVVEAMFQFLLEHEAAAAVSAKFDCSMIRRQFPEVDQQLPGML